MVTFVEGVILGLVVANGVVLAETAGVATVVDSDGGSVVGKGVLTVVGISVAATVVVSVVSVAAGFACCVAHPLIATSTITRMNKPIKIFMKLD